MTRRASLGRFLRVPRKLYSAATGNYGTPAKAAQIGSILPGPMSRLGTLVAGGSLAQAERNAGYESMWTAGTGLVDGLTKESADFVTGVADWTFTYLGMQPSSGCGGGGH